MVLAMMVENLFIKGSGSPYEGGYNLTKGFSIILHVFLIKSNVFLEKRQGERRPLLR